MGKANYDVLPMARRKDEVRRKKAELRLRLFFEVRGKATGKATGRRVKSFYYSTFEVIVQ